MGEQAKHGWDSDFPTFVSTSRAEIVASLNQFIPNAGDPQQRAWQQSVGPLQGEVDAVIRADENAPTYSTILEYELPMEGRRPDVILLSGGAVVVLELKGRDVASQADVDQVAAYARDLRCYHAACEDYRVVPVVVPMRARGHLGNRNGVEVIGPDAIREVIAKLRGQEFREAIQRHQFLEAGAYRPLPTLVEAARELFKSGELRTIKRARAATDPAVESISEIIHAAAARKGRHLVLLTGVPGAGKTLVGLRVAHAHFLDDLAVERADGMPTAPAVFLSGNGPLVQVLQYELKGAGGGGKAFVRGVKDYVKRYSARDDLIPPEHVLLFDEAQRAFDAEQVKAKHSRTPGFGGGLSEPEHFIEFAERIPEWCVVVGLIGGGQEIHVGEEAGLVQWRHAIERSPSSEAWQIHGPPGVGSVFAKEGLSYNASSALNLDTEIRFHLATELHRFVSQLLDGVPAAENAVLAARLDANGYHLRITRELDSAKEYLQHRYAESRDSRFGLVASSRDRDLAKFGVPNDYASTQRIRYKYGAWYGEDESHEFSCRHLEHAITEFGAQGLELDAVLLAWGTDLIRRGGRWSNERAVGYKNRARIVSPLQLRMNSYRVLLTRGRDATVVFVPALECLDDTWRYLVACGFQEV